MSETREPIERRLFNALGAVFGVVCWLLIIWNYIDPEGPSNFLEDQRARLREWRGYREAMRRTFDEIDNLPELAEDQDSA